VPVIVQRRVPPVTAALIAVTLLLSMAVAIDARQGGELYRRLALSPEAIWRGEVWRLATWPFIHGRPLSLIFACVSLWAFGSDLLIAWGPRRYLRYLAVIVLVAGVGTSLIALLMPAARWALYFGGMVLGDALVIAWARQFPYSPVWVYFVLLLRGSAVVAIIVAATLIFAVYYGIAFVLPELLAIGAALLYMSRTGRRAWLTLRLRLVRRRLRVVRGGRSDR
jgi:membrane associated rhomboid family serine protease